MTNTFILPGDDTFEDMIATMGNGLYAKQLGGGVREPGHRAVSTLRCWKGILSKTEKSCIPCAGRRSSGKGPRCL